MLHMLILELSMFMLLLCTLMLLMLSVNVSVAHIECERFCCHVDADIDAVADHNGIVSVDAAHVDI